MVMIVATDIDRFACEIVERLLHAKQKQNLNLHSLDWQHFLNSFIATGKYLKENDTNPIVSSKFTDLDYMQQVLVLNKVLNILQTKLLLNSHEAEKILKTIIPQPHSKASHICPDSNALLDINKKQAQILANQSLKHFCMLTPKVPSYHLLAERLSQRLWDKLATECDVTSDEKLDKSKYHYDLAVKDAIIVFKANAEFMKLPPEAKLTLIEKCIEPLHKTNEQWFKHLIKDLNTFTLSIKIGLNLVETNHTHHTKHKISNSNHNVKFNGKHIVQNQQKSAAQQNHNKPSKQK